MEMKSITQDELDEMVLKHGLWLEGKDGGEKLKLFNVELSGLHIRDCNLGYSIFENVKMFGVRFNNVDFYKSKFSNVRINNTHIDDSNMKRCIISDSSIRFSRFNNVDLELAGIDHTMFAVNNMYSMNLLNCDLNNVILDYCELDGSLYEAVLNNLIITHSTVNDLIQQIGPIGSRKAYTSYFVDKDNVRCGCWKDNEGGTLEEFKKAVEKTYPDGKYHDEYMIAIETFKKYREMYLKYEKE